MRERIHPVERNFRRPSATVTHREVASSYWLHCWCGSSPTKEVPPVISYSSRWS